MKWLKRCRWIGTGLLLVSCLLMTYLFLPATFSDKKDDGPVVIQMASGTVDFPENDYKFLFSKMGLRYTIIDSNQLNAENVFEKISKTVSEAGTDQAILLANGNSGDLALQVASTWEQIVGVVLISPEFDSQHVLTGYGKFRPNVPVGIFGGKTGHAVSAYEQLSGEDSVIMPGQVRKGLLGGTTYFSPSGDRYFQSWNLFSEHSVFQVYMPLFPHIQWEITSFISNFILVSWEIDSQSCRWNILDLHGVKILSIVLMIAGILFFLSSFGKKSEDLVQNERLPYPEWTQRDAYSLWRNRGLFLGIALALFSALLLSLLFISHKDVLIILACWPVCLYLVQVLAGRKLVSHSLRGQKIFRPESGSMVIIFVLLMIFSVFLKNIQFFSIPLLDSDRRLFILIPVLILLLIGKFMQLSIENHADYLIYKYDLRKPAFSNVFQKLLIGFPYLITLAAGIIRWDTAFCIAVFTMFLVFLLHFWLGGVFRKACTSLLIPSLSSSVMYVILLMV